MPRNPAGELTLSEIRNLARQHNKMTMIKNIDSTSRKSLLSQIEKLGYRVDHNKKRIVKNIKQVPKVIRVGTKGDVKPNIITKKKRRRKALVGQGGSVPLVGGDEI